MSARAGLVAGSGGQERSQKQSKDPSCLTVITRYRMFEHMLEFVYRDTSVFRIRYATRNIKTEAPGCETVRYRRYTILSPNPHQHIRGWL